MSDEALLSVRGVSCVMRSVRALSAVDLDVNAGDIVGIIGPNGAGKTTLINVVSGFLPADEGEVRWLGQPLGRMRPHRIARLGLTRTFQNVGGFTGLTVEQNMLLATRGKNAGAVAEIRALLGLDAVWSRQVDDCTLATRKLVGIAVAMSRTPRLLLLDEPLAGLDSADRDHVVEMIQRVHASGVSICLIEHDIARTRKLVTRLIVLDAGVKIADGHPDELARQPELASAYLHA